MGLGTKIAEGVGISLITAVGISGVRLYLVNRNLIITHRVKASNLSLKGVTLTIDVVMKNNTAGSMTIKYPVLSVMLGKTPLATSVAQETDITIKPYSVTEIKDITFNLTLVDEIDIAASLLVPMLTGQPATIRAVTQTRVKFLFFHFPHTTEQDLVLNKNNGSKNG